MSRIAEQVREFHETYGCEIAPVGYQGLGDDALRRMRGELIREEFIDELLPALGLQLSLDGYAVERDPNSRLDRVEVADALGDIAYVVFGAALSFGIDLDAVVDEIHRSNMSKLGEDGKPIYREDGKVLKGSGYFRPDLKKVLGLG